MQQPRSTSDDTPAVYGEPSQSRMSVAERVLRIAVVDAEALSRSILVRLCQSFSAVELVAQAATGAEGLDALLSKQPDVLLIDVNLPDMDGFDLVHASDAGRPTLSIVVSARSSQAAAAYDADVVDFLVKPVATERFEEALRRAHRRRETLQPPPASVMPATRPPNTRPDTPHFIAGERERKLYLMDPRTIDYIEAYGNYVRIWSGNHSYISRERIAELAATLSAMEFVRIERSKLLNFRAVAYIEKSKPGTFTFTLSSGARIDSTPTYRDEILRAVHPGTLSVRNRVKA
jgi:two-component system, LytTR family, response regulator